MNASADTFSSLEALLLFQALAAYGAYSDVFDRISESLKSCYLTEDALSQDPDRYRPEVIRDFCLQQLNEHASQNSRNEDEAAQVNGDGGKSPKKRKIGSPKLKTIEDASREGHLIPQTVAKLYARYQEQAVQDIRREEKEYDALVEELEQEKSEAQKIAQDQGTGIDDEDVQTEDAATAPATPATLAQSQAASAQTAQAQETLVDEAEKTAPQPTGEKLASSEQQSEAQPLTPAIKFDAPVNAEESIEQPSTSKAKPSPTLLPSTDKQPSPAQVLQDQPKKQPPVLAPAPSSSHSQAASSQSPVNSQEPKLSSQPVQPAPNQPSHLNQPPHTVPQPPIAAANPSPPHRSSIPPVDPYAASRYGTPPHPQQQQQQQQHPYPNQPAPYHDPAQYQHPSYPPRGYPFPNQPPYNQPPQGRYGYPLQSPVHSYPPAPPPKGGVQLPPFQITPQPSTGQAAQAQNRQSTTPRPIQPRVASVKGATSLAPLQTPARSPGPISALRNREKPGSKLSPGSQTAFKLHLPKRTPVDKKPPEREVSPITEDAPKTEPKTGTTKKGKPKPAPVKTGKSTRASSKTPSASATSSHDRTRSQSAVSDQDEAPAPSTRRATRRTKAEPATPAITADEHSDSAPPTTVVRGGRAAPPKRKRASSTLDRDDLAPSSPSSPAAARQPPPRLHDAGIVIAQKQFNKVSSAIMNNIISHKHAGIFQNPVKDREAPGYSQIIRRPQDLKSIKNAITVGSRAVNALTSSTDPIIGSPALTPGAPTPGGSGVTGSSSSATVPLAWNEDIVPPKGIVNSAQLEAEIMRMFANAVMFNHPGDPVLADTVEMGDEVMRMVAAWRAGGGSGEDGGADGDEGASTPVGKKRRL